MNSSRILLGLNIDHCATLRQARYRDYDVPRGQMVEPDPVTLALLAEQAGVDGITVHLREDARHIQAHDVERLRTSLRTRLNLEMAATEQMTAFACRIRPDSVCLVPENRAEVTTEGGLDVAGQADRIRETVAALQAAGILVSLFVDPEPNQLQASAAMQADMVELHTGTFANHYYDRAACRQALDQLIRGAEQAHTLGLTVNAGHGINYINISSILEIPWLHELNIGHSILSRALFTGIEEAVTAMRIRLSGQPPRR